MAGNKKGADDGPLDWYFDDLVIDAMDPILHGSGSAAEFLVTDAEVEFLDDLFARAARRVLDGE